jgi:hypothetical protein
MVFAYYLIYKGKGNKIIYKGISYRNNRNKSYKSS